MKRGAWGNAKVWPMAALVLGLTGGWALGRTVRKGPIDADPKPLSHTGADGARTPGFARAEDDPDARRAAIESNAAATAAAHRAALASTVVPPGSMRAFLTSNPPGAIVSRATDGKILGTTPFQLVMPKGVPPLWLRFSKQGFTTRAARLVRQGEAHVDILLAVPSAPQRHLRKRRGVSPTTTIDPFK